MTKLSTSITTWKSWNTFFMKLGRGDPTCYSSRLHLSTIIFMLSKVIRSSSTSLIARPDPCYLNIPFEGTINELSVFSIEVIVCLQKKKMYYREMSILKGTTYNEFINKSVEKIPRKIWVVFTLAHEKVDRNIFCTIFKKLHCTVSYFSLFYKKFKIVQKPNTIELAWISKDWEFAR